MKSKNGKLKKNPAKLVYKVKDEEEESDSEEEIKEEKMPVKQKVKRTSRDISDDSDSMDEDESEDDVEEDESEDEDDSMNGEDEEESEEEEDESDQGEDDEEEETVTKNNKRKRSAPEPKTTKKKKTGEQAYLLVGGLKENTTGGSVKSFFKRRNIDITEVIKVPAQKIMYLVLEKKDVGKALKANNKRLHGNKIKLEKINRLPSQNELMVAGEPNNQLLVRNLSFDTREDKIKEVFNGSTSVKILFYQDSQRPRGLAVVSYNSIEEAEAGMKEHNGVDIDGRKVYVCYALKRKKNYERKKRKKREKQAKYLAGKLQEETDIKKKKSEDKKKRKKENKSKMEEG